VLRILGKTIQQELSLVTERLVLRLLKPDEVTEEYVRGLNDIEITRYLTNTKRNPQTFETVKEFVSAHWKSPNQVLFGLFLTENRRLIGTIRLHGISYHDYFGMIGICLFAKDCWGKGYGLEALNKVTHFAFHDLGLHYIEAGSYEENLVSLSLFRKAGFSTIANYKNKYRFEDRFASVIILGLVNSGFDESLLRTDAR